MIAKSSNSGNKLSVFVGEPNGHVGLANSKRRLHFVAKVVKTFGVFLLIAESLDDFRYKGNTIGRSYWQQPAFTTSQQQIANFPKLFRKRHWNANMAGPALDYRYVYPFESVIARRTQANANGLALQLATCTGVDESPYFFEGSLKNSFQVARLLHGLVQLVRTRFHVHQEMLPKGIADPIITAHENFLRFEIFSGCCSVYARVDLPADAIDGKTLGRGTTNVDFNPALVAALGKVRSTDTLDVSVGADEFVLENASNRAVEKRVQLPIRWLKGLVAVTSYGKQLSLQHNIGAAHATRFLRSIPRAQDNKSRWWIQRLGQSLRISPRQSKGAVQTGALHRLRVLEELVRFADRLRVYGSDDIEASCWELDCGDARFSLMMTHDVWRGFSGEGQGLVDLAQDVSPSIINRTRSAMTWQSVLDPRELATRLLSAHDFATGLAILSTRGQVGFDPYAGHYFHRELPFDLNAIVKLQPRLKGAHKLIDDNKVTSVKNQPPTFEISSTDTIHTVRLLDTESKCTCPWYAKHKNRRGPCKHILAAQIFASGMDNK
jgi:hypothetical protein